ncbi:MAG: cytochrome c [Saprospiraceae bacterium]
MKNIKYILVIGGLLITFAASLTNCATSQAVTDATGASLWGENCMRCHDAPSPANYRDEHWDMVAMHMKVRSNGITDEEMAKIVSFLKSAN